MSAEDRNLVLEGSEQGFATTRLEALLGLLQVRAKRDSVLYRLSDITYGTATGTFVNHNHFAVDIS